MERPPGRAAHKVCGDRFLSAGAIPYISASLGSSSAKHSFSGDERMLVFSAILWLLFDVWVLVIEEPALGNSFGDEFATFKDDVRADCRGLRFGRGRRRKPVEDRVAIRAAVD